MIRRERRANRHGRDDLVGEHPWGDAGQLLLAALFFVIWIGDQLLGYTTFLNDVVPLFVRIPVGTLLLILAGYLSTVSMRIVFGERRETPHVIRKGVFGVVRHPMYLSEVLLYLGLLLVSLSLAACAVVLIAVAFLHYISRHEERRLVARFGDAYRQYMRDVPMWIPRIHQSRGGPRKEMDGHETI
jgi:protein-S-isoprenylcysteine O-methyltransferase Ste14